MNKKIILYIISVVVLIITIIFVAINDSRKTKIENEEQKKIEQLNKEIEEEITENLQNITPNQSSNNTQQNNEKVASENENVTEKTELTHSEITGNHDEIQYSDSLFNSYIEETINSLSHGNVMDVVDLLESKLVTFVGMNENETKKVFDLRDKLNNMKTVYENHSDLSSSFVDPELDFNYIVMVNRTIPFKELVLPYTFSIQHEVLINTISSPESLLPFVIEDDELSFGKIEEYELETLYELKGMYGSEAKTYIQDFTLNGDKLYAILLSHKDGFMVYKIVNNSNGEITKNPLIDYGTVKKWKNFYSDRKK